MPSLNTLTATVTSLEMRASPSSYPHVPLGLSVALLHCHQIPLHFYRYLYDRVGREWNWSATLELSDQTLQDRIWSSRTEIRVLYLDGSPAGFFELLDLPEKECRLLHFGLMNHAIGKGLSRWFLGSAVEAAWLRRPEYITVETCTLDHPAALTLYQKMGFSPINREIVEVTPLSDEERALILLRP